MPSVVTEEAFAETRSIVGQLYPDYLADFDATFARCEGSYLNMLVARREVFDAYCTWLFDVLFQLADRIAQRSGEVKPRMYAHLSERLLNVYFRHNAQLGCAFLPVSNMEHTRKQRHRFFRRLYRNNLYSIAWRCMHRLRKLFR